MRSIWNGKCCLRSEYFMLTEGGLWIFQFCTHLKHQSSDYFFLLWKCHNGEILLEFELMLFTIGKRLFTTRILWIGTEFNLRRSADELILKFLFCLFDQRGGECGKCLMKIRNEICVSLTFVNFFFLDNNFNSHTYH